MHAFVHISSNTFFIDVLSFNTIESEEFSLTLNKPQINEKKIDALS
jgi:hypothetical protein